MLHFTSQLANYVDMCYSTFTEEILIDRSPQSIDFNWSTSVFSSCRDNHCQRRQRNGERHSRKGILSSPCMLVDWTPTAGAGVVALFAKMVFLVR